MLETLKTEFQTAKRDLGRARILHANKLATYDDMAEAAKRVSNALFAYESAKFPTRKAKRRAYQAILR